jgi:uncharacterized protein (AIM24 family)
MCAQDGVELKMHFKKKLGAGLFGGEGFILEQITGPGYAFLEIPGEVREYVLAAGESMKIDPVTSRPLSQPCSTTSRW